MDLDGIYAHRLFVGKTHDLRVAEQVEATLQPGTADRRLATEVVARLRHEVALMAEGIVGRSALY